MGMRGKEWKNDTKSTLGCLRPCSYPGIWSPKEVKMAKQGVGSWKTPWPVGTWRFLWCPAENWEPEGWNSHLESPMDKELPCCSPEGTPGQGEALQLLCPSLPLPQPSHFHQADRTSPQHKLLPSASPHGSQCNLSPCFPAVMWNDKFHEELYHTST